MARSISVVVTGSSRGRAAIPKKPLTPPVTPASSDEARCAGGRFDRGSIERTAMLRHCRIAASTALWMRRLANFGIRRSMRAIGAPA
jgi:hypothetical protein